MLTRENVYIGKQNETETVFFHRILFDRRNLLSVIVWRSPLIHHKYMHLLQKEFEQISSVHLETLYVAAFKIYWELLACKSQSWFENVHIIYSGTPIMLHVFVNLGKNTIQTGSDCSSHSTKMKENAFSAGFGFNKPALHFYTTTSDQSEIHSSESFFR